MKITSTQESGITFTYTYDELQQELADEIEKSNTRAGKYTVEVEALKKQANEQPKLYDLQNKVQAAANRLTYYMRRARFLRYYADHLPKPVNDRRMDPLTFTLTLKDIDVLGLVQRPGPGNYDDYDDYDDNDES